MSSVVIKVGVVVHLCPGAAEDKHLVAAAVVVPEVLFLCKNRHEGATRRDHGRGCEHVVGLKILGRYGAMVRGRSV